jgi:tetratricopeptide (TPR) repeat protein
VYNNIGLVYFQLEQFNEAINYYSKGFAIEEEFENVSGQSIVLLNIGLSYNSLEEFDKALEFFSLTLEKCDDTCPNSVKIQAIAGIGLIHYYKGQYEEAIEEFNEAIDLSSKLDMMLYVPAYFHYLAEIEMENENYQGALAMLDKSELYAKEYSDAEWHKHNLESYLEIHQRLGNSDQALVYASELIEVKDSLLNAEVVKNLTDIHVNIQQEKDASIILGKDLEISDRTQLIIIH